MCFPTWEKKGAKISPYGGGVDGGCIQGLFILISYHGTTVYSDLENRQTWEEAFAGSKWETGGI